MKITVAHSPDSDDAFMFFGLASGAVHVEGIEVDQVLADIETLNRAAFEGAYEVTRRLVSRLRAPARSATRSCRTARAWAIATARFSWRGRARASIRTRDRSHGLRVAIPGKLTSAFLTLQLYDPSFDFEVLPFDQIQQAVLDGRVDAGLLIHEGQLTYAAEGLRKMVDLGEWWFERTGGLPLPLGGNVIRRDLGPAATAHRVADAPRQHRPCPRAPRRGRRVRAAVRPRARRRGHGQFVGMYVNQFTLDYGTRGRAALERFFGEAFDQGLIPHRVSTDFV